MRCGKGGDPMAKRISWHALLAGGACIGIVHLSNAAMAQPVENAQLRLTPDEYLALETIKDRGGAPGAPPLESRVLKGDPSKLGLYTILLKIPARTRIAAHSHPDERVLTVIAGTLHFGYGEHFDENALKPLPAGSFCTEPVGVSHFFRSGDEPVVVQITGVGPTGTSYSDPARRRFDSDK
jgi:quercetin dioxygenase-like cupin family protein